MTETGAQRFEAAWREACANHENMTDAIGRLLDEQGARLARVEALADDERAAMDLWWDVTEDDWAVPDWLPAKFLRAALAHEAEGATS